MPCKSIIIRLNTFSAAVTRNLWANHPLPHCYYPLGSRHWVNWLSSGTSLLFFIFFFTSVFSDGPSLASWCHLNHQSGRVHVVFVAIWFNRSLSNRRLHLPLLRRRRREERWTRWEARANLIKLCGNCLLKIRYYFTFGHGTLYLLCI